MRPAMLTAVAAVAALATACGSGSDDAERAAGGTTSTATVAESPSTAPVAGDGGPVEVKVTVGESGPNAMYVTSSLTTFEVGVPYHFVVTNLGEKEHELMLIQPIAAGMMDMEEMDSMALAVIEEDDLQPGATASFDETFDEALPAGSLEFACHIENHYEVGMKLPITVTG